MDFHLEHALLPAGWAQDVRVGVEDGAIVSVEPAARGRSNDGVVSLPGIALPGLPNIHCHAFQRAMAALAERRGPTADSFWTWRQVMYHFLEHLTPDDIEAIAAFAYKEMLERGFTAVAEFHYLHHDSAGRPYANPAETSERIAAAAAATGIGLTLLPCFYAFGGFGGAAPVPGQKRFLNDPERFLRLVEGARRAIAALPDAKLGIAPHSLRAVTPETLRAVVGAVPTGPIHMHAAEQTQEVDDCVAWSGARPVEWLLANSGIDERWCLIHATHMTEAETRGLASAGATAGLCPLTEASLGDGIFNAATFAEAGGRLAVGTDSQIEITAAGELKQLEYSQRLRHRARNVLATAAGQSTGRALYEAAASGGAVALQRRVGAIAPGARADLVILDAAHPDMVGVEGDRWLDAYVFACGHAAIRTVVVGGRTLVDEGRHVGADGIERRYAAVKRRLAAGG